LKPPAHKTSEHRAKIASFACAAIIACTAVCFTTGAGAQSHVGVKTAFGLTSVDALPDFKKRSLSTYINPGLYYRYEHKEFAAIQVEANYIRKGFIRETDTATMTPEITERITAFELPLMAQGFVRLGIFRPYLTGGVTAGYILSRSSQVQGTTTSTPHLFNEYDRRFEYGISGGGGVGITIASFEIQAEARFHYNFSFLKDPIIPNQNNSYLNSTQLMLSLSISYKIKN
jgi:hypothetical protein